MGGLGSLDHFDQEGDLRIIYLGGGCAVHQLAKKLDAAQVAFDGPDLEVFDTAKVVDEESD